MDPFVGEDALASSLGKIENQFRRSNSSLPSFVGGHTSRLDGVRHETATDVPVFQVALFFCCSSFVCLGWYRKSVCQCQRYDPRPWLWVVSQTQTPAVADSQILGRVAAVTKSKHHVGNGHFSGGQCKRVRNSVTGPYITF